MYNQPYQPDPRTSPPAYPPDAETAPSVVNNMESRRENYVDRTGTQVDDQVDVYEDKNLRRASLRYWVTGLLYFLLGVLEVILGLRFIFRLLGANRGNDFVLALYDFSHVFVGPFNGIFNDQTIGSKSVFELSTLIAMLIYALIGWGLIALARVLFAPTYGSAQRVTTTRRSMR